ncbi:transposase [Sphaerisporangium sp. NPDC051017]|uniref:IS66 family transposase n=1 Tax=Sphaerisporangium sp. NPDC051017 TaxID=3154636 RepID=UPI003437A1BB
MHRCAELVASPASAKPSAGFVHGLIARAADLVASANARIRALLTLAYVVCCDETPIRAGPKKAKTYLLVACTDLFTCYMLDRDMATFKKFVIAELTGVIVHDRYQNYDSADSASTTTSCARLTSCLIMKNCAETYPGACRPAQIQTALRGLIHAANLARKQGKDAIHPGTKRIWISSFRHGCGWACRRFAASRPGRDRHPARWPRPAGSAARPRGRRAALRR